jgi:hypothetical protein
VETTQQGPPRPIRVLTRNLWKSSWLFPRGGPEHLICRQKDSSNEEL